MSDELDDFLNGGAEDTTVADQVADETLAQGDEQTGDDAAAEPNEGQDEGEQPRSEKPRKSVQERIDEMTRLRREAEKRADYWERVAREGRAPEPKADQQPAAEAEPDPSKYQYGETDAAYIRDLARYEARQEFKAEAERHQRQTQAETIERTWSTRQQDFAKDNPDFFEKVSSDDLTITPVMADAIKTSEDGPRVAYHLAQNPDEARRIAGLPPLAQVRELGRLEAKLAQPAASTPQPKTVSDAPPPHPQARGLSGRFTPAPDTDDLDAFERTFFASR